MAKIIFLVAIAFASSLAYAEAQCIYAPLMAPNGIESGPNTREGKFVGGFYVTQSGSTLNIYIDREDADVRFTRIEGYVGSHFTDFPTSEDGGALLPEEFSYVDLANVESATVTANLASFGIENLNKFLASFRLTWVNEHNQEATSTVWPETRVWGNDPFGRSCDQSFQGTYMLVTNCLGGEGKRSEGDDALAARFANAPVFNLEPVKK